MFKVKVNYVNAMAYLFNGNDVQYATSLDRYGFRHPPSDIITFPVFGTSNETLCTTQEFVPKRILR